MRGAKHTAAAVAMLRRQASNQCATRVVQSGEGFIKHPQRLPPQQQAGQGNAPALTLGQSTAGLLQGIAKTHLRQGVSGGTGSPPLVKTQILQRRQQSGHGVLVA